MTSETRPRCLRRLRVRRADPGRIAAGEGTINHRFASDRDEIGESSVFLFSYLRDIYICTIVLPCHFATQGPICHLGTCPAESDNSTSYRDGMG
jgi:hypothetical protein